MVRCLQCGAKIKKRANFCPVCGERISFQQAGYTAEQKGVKGAVREGQAEDVLAEGMLKPMAGKLKRRRQWIITAAFLFLLALLGFLCIFDVIPHWKGSPLMNFFAKAEADKLERKEQENAALMLSSSSRAVQVGDIPGLREAYYEQGLAFMDDYVSDEKRQEAINKGSEAFFSAMDKSNIRLKAHIENAENEAETLFANTVRELCLYALSTDAEEALAEESGGGFSEADRARIALRREKLAELCAELRQASDLKTLDSIRTELNNGR